MPVQCTAVVEGNLIRILHRCRQEKNADQARHLHAYLCQHRLESHPVFGNCLVPLLVDCGHLLLAQHVFDALPHCNEHSWTALISGYIACGNPYHAFQLYHKMLHSAHVPPSRFTYLALLTACAKLKDADRGREMHAGLTKMGSEKELYVGCTLVDMYSKCGLLAEAECTLDMLPERNVVSWNALIAGYVEDGLNEQVGKCFHGMQLEGVVPDSVTCLSSLRACCTGEALERGQEVHDEIVKRGLESELYVGTTLVDMYAKCTSLSEACQVFDKLPVRNTVSWNVLIAGYAELQLVEETQNCLKQMQLEGISPDSVTYICSLKACATKGDSELAQRLHTEIIKRGFEGEVYVGSTLVDFYCKCALLAEGCQVFEALPVRSSVTWGALIAGFAEQGLGETAWKCLQEMHHDGFSPDPVTFICSLKACGSTGTLTIGHYMHTQVVKYGFDREQHLGNTLVYMYSKLGFLAEACRLFDGMPVRDAVSWAVLIAGYASYGYDAEVLNCILKMELEDVSANAITCVYSLKSCGTIGAVQTGYGVHSKIIKRGFERELLLGTTVVDMYRKCSLLTEARCVFDRLPFQERVSWTTLISGYGECVLGEELTHCFQEFQSGDIDPDLVFFICSLKACGSVEALETGHTMHNDIIKRGLERDLHIGCTLVDMYFKCNSLPDAQRVFDRLTVRNNVLWNALIAGYANQEFAMEAIRCFKQMQLEGIIPDSTTFLCGLKACGSLRALQTIREMHSEVTKRGLEIELNMGNTLIDVYRKCGPCAEAHSVFDGLRVRDAVSWDVLIGGYAEYGHDEEVLRLFEQVHVEDISADAFMFIPCLKACCNRGALETGRKLHAEIRKLGLERDTFVCNLLIHMYGKCGSVCEGREVFDRLSVKDIVSWTAMIKAYGENDDENMAIQCFEDMQEKGVKPDATTFACVLAICSHSSLVLNGFKYFKMMIEEYRIEPTLNHYSCMVDLLARSGYFYEVERFIAAMQFVPSSIISRSLLSACRLHGKVDLGQTCFQQLVEMNQEDGSAYLLLADLYASADRLSEAKKVEEVRKSARVKKVPGNAAIEVNKKRHELIVGSNQNENISEMIKCLSACSMNENYLPRLDLHLRHISDVKDTTCDEYVNYFPSHLYHNSSNTAIETNFSLNITNTVYYDNFISTTMFA